MAQRGAQPGNQNASKGRVVEALLRKICTQEDNRRIAQGLNALLEKAAEGDMMAISFITDRLDGKAKQAVELSGDAESPIVSLVATSEELRKVIRGEKK